MKKSIKYLLTILLLLFSITHVQALNLSQSEYEDYNIKRAYVVGKYIFDLSKHNPTLKDLMLAAQSSPKGEVSIIEIKIATNINGEETKEYRELLDGTKLTEFPKLDVKYIYSSEVMPETPDKENKIVLEETGSGGEPDIPDQPDEPIIDTTSPSCAWSNLNENLAIDTTAVITLTCTDASGIKTSILTSSAFTINGDFTIQSIQTETIANGYKYNLTLQGIDRTNSNIILKADQIEDNNGNKNKTIESESFAISKVIKGIFYRNGAAKIQYGAEAYIDESVEIKLCTLTTNESCSVTLPTIIGEVQTPVVLGWSESIGADIKYNSNSQVTLSDDITLYAQTKGLIEINFSANNCVTENKKATLELKNGQKSGNVLVPEATTLDGFNTLGVSPNPIATTSITPIGARIELNNILNTNAIEYYYNCETAGSGEESKDEISPVCVWEELTENFDVIQTKTISLTCTDENGIASKSLSSNSFVIEPNASVTVQNVTTSEVTNGYKYIVTLKPTTYGMATIALKENQIQDNNGNGNIATTSEAFNITQTLVGIFNLNGEKAFKYNGHEYTQSYINQMTLGGSSSVIFNNKTYTESDLETICSTRNNNEVCSISFSLCTITNGHSCEATLPEIIPNDENGNILGFSFNYDNGETVNYRSGETVMISSNLVNLYSHVETGGDGVDEAVYTATFMPNGGEGTEFTKTCTVASGASSCEIELPNNIFTFKSWEFNNWSIDASSKEGTAPTTKVTLTDNVRYYALWKKIARITVKANGCAVQDKVTYTSTMYNGSTNGWFMVPTVSMNDGWTSLGASRSASSTTQGAAIGATSGMTIYVSKNSTSATAYYNCKKDSKTFTATFNGNGGTGSTNSVSCSIAETYNGTEQETSCMVILPSNGFTYDDWTFNGWTPEQNATSGASAGSNINLTENKTYYASWKKVVTITFKANNCTTSDQIVKTTLYNSATSATISVPSAAMNTNWTSLGASETASQQYAGIAMSSSMNITGIGLTTNEITRYYNCSKSITVTFEANSCTTGDKTVNTILYNGEITKNITVPNATMNSGWTSLGASPNQSQQVVGTAFGGTMAISVVPSATTLNRYYNCSKEVTVTFNSNSCTTSNQTAKQTIYNGMTSATITVPTVAMNTNWTSLGASSNASSTSQGTAMGSSMTIENISSATTTAIRYYNCKKDVTTTFKANGCTTSDNTVNTILYNGEITASITVPSATMNSGWKSLGASPNQSQQVVGTAFGGTMAISVVPSATTLNRYYNCSKEVTVTFNSNSCTTSNQTAKQTIYNGMTSTDVTVPNATMNTNWTSLGASASASSTSQGTAMGSTMAITGLSSSTTTVTRYYNCKKDAKIYTAKFSCNGGIGTVANTTCTIPEVYNGENQENNCELYLPTSGCTRSGWKFIGWNVSSTATTGASGASLPASTDKQYYAIWEKPKKTYVLTLYGNGGSGSTASVSCNIPAAYNGDNQASTCNVTYPSNGFTYSGWTFNGWAASSSYTAGSPAGSILALSADTSRYATWEKTYTLTTNKGANVSSIGAVSRKCSVYNGDAGGCTVYLPSITPNTGYTSVGWGTSNGSTSGTAANTSIVLTTDKVLYANAVDQTAPTCGAISNAGSSSSWVKSRTIEVACNDSGSGCTQPSFTKTFSSGTSTSGIITISDKAGNTTNCTVATYIDNTAPTCGTVTGASTEWSSSARNISVACNDNASGCVQPSFSKNFTDTKTGTITIKDNAGNTTNCYVNAYVDTTGPSCGVVTGASTSWINSGNREISVACSDSVSGCTDSEFSYVFVASRKTGTITIKNNAGITKECTVNVYIDTVAPTCGTITNESTTWRKTTQSISVGCNDSVSGCTNSTVSKTFSSAKIGTITISDVAGNTKNCSVNAYVDTASPTISCSVTGGGTSGVNATVSVTGSISGLTVDPSGPKEGLTSTTTYKVTNSAGSSATCTINVTKSIYDYTKREYACSTPTWSSAVVSYTAMGGCTSVAASASGSSYTACTSDTTSACSSAGFTIPCMKKSVYTRTGCSAYSTTVKSTTYPTNCSASNGMYSKYTCTPRTYTYSGSV